MIVGSIWMWLTIRRLNFLYHNSRDGTLTGEAVLMDAAFDENGKAQDCMGINVTDAVSLRQMGKPSYFVIMKTTKQLSTRKS